MGQISCLVNRAHGEYWHSELHTRDPLRNATAAIIMYTTHKDGREKNDKSQKSRDLGERCGAGSCVHSYAHLHYCIPRSCCWARPSQNKATRVPTMCTNPSTSLVRSCTNFKRIGVQSGPTAVYRKETEKGRQRKPERQAAIGASALACGSSLGTCRKTRCDSRPLVQNHFIFRKHDASS